MRHLSKFQSVIILVVICLLMPSTNAYSQDKYEQWLKERNKKIVDYQRERQEQLQIFLDDRDRLFSEFLRIRWKQFEAFAGLELDKTPKPPVVPVYEPPDTTMVRPEPKEPDKPPIVEPPPIVPPQPEPKPPPMDPRLAMLSVPFLGDTLSIPMDKSMPLKFPGPLDNSPIASHWERLAKAQYPTTLESLKGYEETYVLNDWGYGNLVQAVANHLYGDASSPGKTLFVWFFLVKSGYDVKVGYNADHLALLVPTDHIVYNTRYYQISDEGKYYTLSFGPKPTKDAESLRIYEGTYPDATRRMNYGQNMVPKVANRMVARKRTFTYNGTRHEVNTLQNTSVVQLYRHFPLIDLPLYFKAPLSTQSDDVLLQSLSEVIDGKSEYEAVNTLLRFVQTAFDYQVDGQQFGREKYLIPDETLAYDYCDCEDRSILFAYLVRTLVGLPIIGLDYPGHIATAVKFKGFSGGAKVKYNGSRYTICDPTYINADVGIAMPQFKDVKPAMISIR